MANSTDPFAASVHGTNPQNLVEKILRNRIYANLYWKEHCFGLNAESLVDKACDLKYFGGAYSAMQKPSPFLCLLLKMLQIQPELDIVREFVKNGDYKYVRVLGAIYFRIVARPAEVYGLLEPLYNDFRRLRRRTGASLGGWELTTVDQFARELLTEEMVCDVTMPRLPPRAHLETQCLLEPYVSALDGVPEGSEAGSSTDEEGAGGGAGGGMVASSAAQRVLSAAPIVQRISEAGVGAAAGAAIAGPLTGPPRPPLGGVGGVGGAAAARCPPAGRGSGRTLPAWATSGALGAAAAAPPPAVPGGERGRSRSRSRSHGRSRSRSRSSSPNRRDGAEHGRSRSYSRSRSRSYSRSRSRSYSRSRSRSYSRSRSRSRSPERGGNEEERAAARARRKAERKGRKKEKKERKKKDKKARKKEKRDKRIDSSLFKQDAAAAAAAAAATASSSSSSGPPAEKEDDVAHWNSVRAKLGMKPLRE
jgi:pre-mRNA-splicing factor 38A